MKKHRITALLLAAIPSALLLTGCAFGSSIDNLMTPPKLSVEQEQIYKALTDDDNVSSSSISLKYPKQTSSTDRYTPSRM